MTIDDDDDIRWAREAARRAELRARGELCGADGRCAMSDTCQCPLAPVDAEVTL